jgi:hypothetical protein
VRVGSEGVRDERHAGRRRSLKTSPT